MMQEAFNDPEAFLVLKGKMLQTAQARLLAAKEVFKKEKKFIKALTFEKYRASLDALQLAAETHARNPPSPAEALNKAVADGFEGAKA